MSFNQGQAILAGVVVGGGPTEAFIEAGVALEILK